MKLLWSFGATAAILWLALCGLPNARLIYLALSLPDGGEAAFSEPWQAESYRAGHGSAPGALGIRSCAPWQPWLANSASLLRVTVDFDQKDPDRQQGECWFDVETLGLGRVLNLGGGTVEAGLSVPFALTSKDERARIAGAQLIAESESTDGHRGRLYSSWEDFTNWWDPEVRSLVITSGPLSATAWRDANFNPLRVVRLGLKVALNSAAGRPFQGSVIVTRFSIRTPNGAASHAEREQLRVERRAPSDDDMLGKLKPLDSSFPGANVLADTLTLVPVTKTVHSVTLVPEPATGLRSVWRVQLHFPFYTPGSAGRSARLAYQLERPLDLSRKQLTAWAAVGPSLRGFIPRPNRIQFVLLDEQGRVLRGSAADISAAGMFFDSNAREAGSKWIRFEVTPGAHGPLSLGFVDEGFDAARVREVGIRFLIGKFSDQLRLEPYPLAGPLLLSKVLNRGSQQRPGAPSINPATFSGEPKASADRAISSRR